MNWRSAPSRISYREARKLAESARSVSDCADLWRERDDQLIGRIKTLDEYIADFEYEQRYRKSWWK
jgi:hypothetical protein